MLGKDSQFPSVIAKLTETSGQILGFAGLGQRNRYLVAASQQQDAPEFCTAENNA
jgi:hypothetical protein